MIRIDGAAGEGGGQILRSSLALAMCTQQPVHIVNIRANRRKPGLLRQHLTAVRAAAEISRGKLDGERIGASEIRFAPGPVHGGEYQFSVGTAGSSNLVFQTVLPALLYAPKPSKLALEGGTHNPMAPPFEFIAHAFIPLLERMGANLNATLERPGFYPAGGGRWQVTIQPDGPLKALTLTERGTIRTRGAFAISAGLPKNIARRELQCIAEMMNWENESLHQRQLPEQYGPGNYVQTQIESDNVTEVFTSFGQRGYPAEKVAKDCARQTRRYLTTDVPVGEYLADQLLLPIALAGAGKFITTRPSNHTQTNIAIIERFLAVRFTVTKITDRRYQIDCQQN